MPTRISVRPRRVSCPRRSSLAQSSPRAGAGGRAGARQRARFEALLCLLFGSSPREHAPAARFACAVHGAVSARWRVCAECGGMGEACVWSGGRGKGRVLCRRQCMQRGYGWVLDYVFGGLGGQGGHANGARSGVMSAWGAGLEYVGRGEGWCCMHAGPCPAEGLSVTVQFSKGIRQGRRGCHSLIVCVTACT